MSSLPLSYQSSKCVMEFLSAKKRIPFIAISPFLRTIERLVPLHIRSLRIEESFYQIIYIDSKPYYLGNEVTVEKALDGLFKNRKAAVYIHQFWTLSLGKLTKFGSQIVPTYIITEASRKSDVIFGRNAEIFSTDKMRKLTISNLNRVKSLRKHPVASFGFLNSNIWKWNSRKTKIRLRK